MVSSSSSPPVLADLPNIPENAPHILPAPFLPGDGVPWFRTPSDVNADFNISSLAGRYVVLSFLGSTTQEPVGKIARDFLKYHNAFDGKSAALAIVSVDPADASSTLTKDLPAFRLFYDFDKRISRMFGLVPKSESDQTAYAPVTFILDDRLRVAAVVPLKDAASHAKQVMDIFQRLPKRPASFVAHAQAPVLIIPNVFEPNFCKALIEGYEKNGGADSGYMKEKDGKTVLEVNHAHKRRSDWMVEEDKMLREIRTRMTRRVLPEIMKAYQFNATRMERYLVACYDAEVAGHFNAHRDNTTKGTAHRRFAVSLNLNADDYEGGELLFPEFGPARYKPPTGGACVFSCSLLHEATQVTRGKRFVFLPFLYDDAAAKIRENNQKYVAMPGAA